MATPLPAVPPPPGPAPADTPESRDPLADRANAAALDATLSKGRNALFDATLDRPIPSRMQPRPPNAPSSPGAARRRFARKMEALDARRDRAAFAHEVAKRQGAARVATAQEFEDVRKRSRARTQAALRAQRSEAVARNRQLLADLDAAEAKADAALSGKSTAAVALRNAAKGVFVAAAELGPEIELQKRRERLEELEALKQRERDAVRKHNDEKLLAAEAADIEAAVRAKRRDVAERELDAARERAARDAERRAAARHDAAVIEALERDAREATDAETAQIKREQEQHTTEVLQGLAAERDRHNADTVLAASGGMLDSEYSSDDAAPPPETPAPAPPDSSSDDDDAAVPPPATSTEGYIPPQTRKKKVDYGAFSASMTRGAADEFDDYD